MRWRLFEKDDVTIAAHVEPLEQVVDLLKDELRMRHINPLQNGRCTLELGFVFNDLVANLSESRITVRTSKSVSFSC